MRIEYGHENYDALYSRWQIEGTPRLLTWNGMEWMALEDNGKMVFVRTGSNSGLDTRYSDSSMPLK